MSDAGHMLSDVGAMGLSLFAAYIAALPATSQKTFGYYRAEILAAFVNGLALWLIAGVIFHEAYHRFFSPPEVRGQGLLLIASVGLGVNLLTAWLLSSSRGHSLNLQGVFLHVMSDALGSIGAITAGTVILFTDWYWADAVASLGIGLLILISSFGLVRDSIDILMQATPRHLSLKEVQKVMEEIEGVQQIHDLHIWTLTSGIFTLSAHAVVDGEQDPHGLLDELEGRIQDAFGIKHITIQLEPQDRQRNELTTF
jgi:cobalt-zinc-cadmium efflux system protein